MAHDLHQVAAGEQIGGVAMCQAFLGQEHCRYHYQRHVMVPRLPAPHLIVTHTAGTLQRSWLATGWPNTYSGVRKIRLITLTQELSFLAQGAHFGNPIQTQPLARFARRTSAQGFDRFQPRQGHEGDHHQQRSGRCGAAGRGDRCRVCRDYTGVPWRAAMKRSNCSGGRGLL